MPEAALLSRRNREDPHRVHYDPKLPRQPQPAQGLARLNALESTLTTLCPGFLSNVRSFDKDPKAEFYTLNGWTIQYVNYISIKTKTWEGWTKLKAGITRHHSRECNKVTSVKGGNSVAFHKQECQIHTLCRYGSLRVCEEGKKSLSGVGCGFLGEVNAAWNMALILAGRRTLLVAGQRLWDRDTDPYYLSTWKDTEKRTVMRVRCVLPPAYHLGKQAEAQQVALSHK